MDSKLVNSVDVNVVQKRLPWRRDDKDETTLCNTEEDIVDHVAELLASGQYYSWAGLTLLAVNPCKNIPQLYTKDIKEQYNCFEKEGIKSELKPHIYAVAARARHRIVYEIGSVNQIISISGDSGSGKTFSAKQILEFLSTHDLHDSHYDVAKVPGILWQIWCSVPVLTAFGNAQTECNDNSSRFGKLLRLQYDDGKIVGAFIQTYLLEKTRVAFQGSKERNFHIFHQLMSGLTQNELSSLHLSHKTFYRIIPTAINLEDRDRFLETKVAMMDIGITEKMRQSVFMVLAAIIHLGNITFARRDGQFDIDRNCMTTLHNVSRLLGLTETTLKELLTSRQIALQSTTNRRTSVYQKPAATVEECNAKRDCLMRLLYERLFLWIVSIINNKVQADGRYQEVGILDIYGFEIFEHNSLEQLCINYANERLQQFFVRDFIKHQQEILQEEGVFINLTADLDNEERLRALDSSVSILGILDERIATTYKKSNVVSCPTPTTSTAEHPNFIFRHYAGQVSYSVHRMLEKNMDHIPSGLTETLAHCLNPFVRQLFHNSFPFPSNRKHTVLGKFRNLLDSLMKLLETADVHYVRCVKAAPKLVPDLVEKPFLKQQLKASGIMEVIFINHHHLPVMMKYDDFEERYAVLLRKIERTKRNIDDNDVNATEKVERRDSRTSLIKEAVTAALGESSLSFNVFFGKKTLFLTERAMLQLENYRHSVRKEAAKCIQRNWRVRRARKLLRPKKIGEKKSINDVPKQVCDKKESNLDEAGAQECDKKEVRQAKTISGKSNDECDMKEPVHEKTDAQEWNDKTEDKPVTDESNNVEENSTKESISNTNSVLEFDEGLKEKKFLIDEHNVEEYDIKEGSSNVTDATECDNEKPDDNKSITAEIIMAVCDEIVPCSDTTDAPQNGKKEYTSDKDGVLEVDMEEVKETQGAEEKEENPIKSKTVVVHKPSKSCRSFYISKGIISRRPLAKVPVRLHTKRTCIPNSHFLPISELPRGLEDALC